MNSFLDDLVQHLSRTLLSWTSKCANISHRVRWRLTSKSFTRRLSACMNVGSGHFEYWQIVVQMMMFFLHFVL